MLELDPLEVAAYLNDRPVTIRGKFQRPAREMRAWVDQILEQ